MFTMPWTGLGCMLINDICFSLRQRGLSGKANAVDGAKRVRHRDRAGRAIPAPEANAEIQTNLDVCLDFLLFILNLFFPLIFFFLPDDERNFDNSLNPPCVIAFLKIFEVLSIYITVSQLPTAIVGWIVLTLSFPFSLA